MKVFIMQRQNWFLGAALLGLAACSSTGTLQAVKPDHRLGGTVTRGLVEPHVVEVTLDGKTYRGEWRTGAPTAAQKAAAGYPHRRHVGQVRSVLTAADGSILDCRWQTHGATGAGSCTAGDLTYSLYLK